MSLCLMMSCVSCTTKALAPRDPRLLEDCDDPSLTGKANGNLLRLTIEQKNALMKCTAQKRALRGERL